MLTLLTTTGERPECFALLKQFMRHQDYPGNVRWVIVDDGHEPADTTFRKSGWTVEHIRPKPYWEPGQNTQHRNLAAGLDVIPDDATVAVIEDDDYYGPAHLSTIAGQFGNINLVGELSPRYYNCQTLCGKRFQVFTHTSLACTAMRGDALQMFRKCVGRGLKYVDVDLWRKYKGPARLYPASNVIGIKGMPGRGGIGGGHKIEFGNIVDPQKFLGDAYRFYKPFIKEFTGAKDMKVKALKAHGYGGHMRKPGDEYFMKDPAHRKIMATLGNIEVLEPPKRKPGRPAKAKPPVEKPVETVDNDTTEETEGPEVKEEKQTYRTRMLKADNEE
jgi:hypothetical protein